MTAPRRTALLLAVTAVGGAGTMVVELAAVRVLAPWFGTSQVVWSNVIAVVLLALALGYAVGGRLAGGERDLRRLGLVLLLAATASAWVPALAGPVAHLFLPERLALHEAAGTILWGSLSTALVLFLPPAALLGCVSPLAVQAVATSSGRGPGAAGGMVLASSTLGSLAGVFATSLFLVPRLGLPWTFRGATLVLALAGLGALWLGGVVAREGKVIGGMLLLAGTSALVPPGRPALSEGARLLAATESAYQSVRVVEREERGERLRFLQVNEGFDSYQSVWREQPGLLPLGYYYNDIVLPSAWSHVSDPSPRSWRVLVLGLGGGSALRVLEGALPGPYALSAVGVELDPEVTRLARKHLDLGALEGRGLRVLAGLDARVALRTEPVAGERFDQVYVDCYANQVELPPHLVTAEFLREVRARLAPGGWLQMNLGGFGFDDPVVAALAHTAAQALASPVLLLRVPFARNVTLVARPGAALPVGESGLLPVTGTAAALLDPRSLPGTWRVVQADAPGVLLTDPHAPVEWLQEESLRAASRRLEDPGPWGAWADAAP